MEKQANKRLSLVRHGGNDMNKKDKEIPTSLLAFTFFYAIGIYLLLLGFYFWHWHKED